MSSIIYIITMLYSMTYIRQGRVYDMIGSEIKMIILTGSSDKEHLILAMNYEIIIYNYTEQGQTR